MRRVTAWHLVFPGCGGAGQTGVPPASPFTAAASIRGVTPGDFGDTVSRDDELNRPLPHLHFVAQVMAISNKVTCLLFAAGSIALAGDLSWVEGNGYRWADLALPSSGRPGFFLTSPEATRIAFTNFLSESRSLTNQIYLNGSGVAAGDMDGDGRCDLYFCGLDRGNALFRNLGNWRFQEITDVAGVRCAGFDSTGAVFADIDGDGDLDLIVNTVGHGTHCFRNNGKGHFTDVTRTMGLSAPHGSMSLALADVDGDGYLDLYVANYRMDTLRDKPNTRFHVQTVNGQPVVMTVDGRPVTDSDLRGRYIVASQAVVENGEADVFYRNSGGTNFSPVSFLDGSFLDEDGQPLKAPPYDWGLSVIFRDLDDDGRPDLYVCNDFESPDRIWINQGEGRFRAISRLALRHTSLFSMGVDVADIDRDGQDDIFVADMLSRDHQKRMVQLGDAKSASTPAGVIDNRPQHKMNTLFRNRGDGTYAEIAAFSGVAASEWSWTPVFLDVDLDGYEDLLVTTGHERDALNMDVGGRLEALRRSGRLQGRDILLARREFPRLATPNLAFRNQGDSTFKESGLEWGFSFPGVSQGMALADLDNDGDLDVVINNLNAGAAVYRNEGITPRLAIKLKGLSPNTAGIGAKIRVLGGPVAQSQEMMSGGRYLSADQPWRVFAAGHATNRLTIEVTWRNGRRSIVANASANRLYEIDETHSLEARLETKAGIKAMFEDVSALIRHVHREEVFDDFDRQPLLTKKLSQMGPGATWFDLDGDGRDDLIIGGGRGGEPAFLLNRGGGKFDRAATGALIGKATDDHATILGLSVGRFVVGEASYESGGTNALTGYELSTGQLKTIMRLPNSESSTGPLALADVDGDRDLDLFVGGRMIPGRYPQPASSAIYRNESGRFELEYLLTEAGLVSGAVFSDLDGDGYPELVLACEWGPVKVCQRAGGTWRERTQALGLDKYTGWWNGVTTGDLDGDGRLDIVASNWGQNTRYQSYRASPLRIYYGDLNGNGTVEMLEAFTAPELKKMAPWLSMRAAVRGMPWLSGKFRTFSEYGTAGIAEILGDRMKLARELEAVWLETTVFLNRGDHFEARALPAEAQFAPAFGVNVADLDGDGNEDIFLSQNFFATAPDVPRYDGGRGLWLKGNGRGNFAAVSGQASGIMAYGEQRGSALCDYDGDGRVDLAVTQNGAETKLYHNVGARAGVRIRLKGPPGNPNGVGATIRLIDGAKEGPAREIHSGSGYWSQDSAVQVFEGAEAARQVRVRWPGGKDTLSPLPAAAREITLENP